jgi:hypothetical protein
MLINHPRLSLVRDMMNDYYKILKQIEIGNKFDERLLLGTR